MLTIPLYDDNPAARPPVVTVLLIAACIVVFLWQQSLRPREEVAVAYALGMVPAVLFGGAQLPPEIAIVPPVATVLTSMFLHGGWMHLIGNMLFLWIFGNNIEDALGHVRYAIFYLACGAIAALAQGLTDPGSEVPMVGASGAIAGVLGAYIVLHPHANVRVFVWILIFVRLVNVPAWILLGLWFAMQLFSGLATPTAEGGVAFWAHVGGFVAGILLVLVMRRRSVALLQPGHSQPFGTAPLQAIADGRRFGGGSVPSAGERRWPPPRRRGPWG